MDNVSSKSEEPKLVQTIGLGNMLTLIGMIISVLGSALGLYLGLNNSIHELDKRLSLQIKDVQIEVKVLSAKIASNSDRDMKARLDVLEDQLQRLQLRPRGDNRLDDNR